jgi:3-methyl-2-oxobutanoate hydroxymethyltransferase
VKLEGAGAMLSRVRAIVAAGIPVVGHVGLLPQSVTAPDGYRARGRDAEQALDIITGAEDLEAAGCAALVIEAVPSEIGAIVTERVRIPVIGIGAGAATGGQVLVYHDLLGLGEGKLPRFVRSYATARETLVDAVRRWAEDVRTGRYPSAEESYGIASDVLAQVRDRLGR